MVVLQDEEADYVLEKLLDVVENPDALISDVFAPIDDLAEFVEELEFRIRTNRSQQSC